MKQVPVPKPPETRSLDEAGKDATKHKSIWKTTLAWDCDALPISMDGSFAAKPQNYGM